MRICVLLVTALSMHAQYYMTALGGTVALSPGSSAAPDPPSSDRYDPKLGPALNLALGRHLSEWFSVQLNYIWNQNRIIYSGVSGSSFSERAITESQHSATVDLLLYFRERRSWVRPYLSAGPAWVRALRRDVAGLRVAVGADLPIRDGWQFRYSFSETISSNPYSKVLRPPGGGKLMNFQNLFGVVKVF